MGKILTVAALLMAAACPSLPQAAPEAARGGGQFVVGVGFSNFHTDWSGRLEGATLWADWNFNHGLGLLRGFGIEVEGRDLNYGRTGNVPNLRQDTAEGGTIYTVHHYRRFQPYGKFLAGFGSIDFGHITPTYSHETRDVFAPGCGVQYRAWRNIWVRADYEYQFWPHFFNDHALNPNGVTVGVLQSF
jgi:opacity protein-like surface antigen